MFLACCSTIPSLDILGVENNEHVHYMTAKLTHFEDFCLCNMGKQFPIMIPFDFATTSELQTYIVDQ